MFVISDFDRIAFILDIDSSKKPLQYLSFNWGLLFLELPKNEILNKVDMEDNVLA